MLLPARVDPYDQPSAAGGGGGSGAARALLLSRPLWLTLIVWGVLAPLAGLRRMCALSHASLAGLLCVAGFVVVTSALAAVAVCTGQAAEVRLWPDPELLTGSRAFGCMGAVLAAFCCHFGVHAIMQVPPACAPPFSRSFRR